MATLSITDQRVTVTLDWWEKLACGRSDFRVPVHVIVGCEAVDIAAEAAAGYRRVQALRIPGVTHTGHYRNERTGETSFIVCHRDGPGVILELDGATVDTIIISTPHGKQYAQQVTQLLDA